MKNISIDATGVPYGVTEDTGNDGDGNASQRAWSFADPVQAKRHQAMFDADLTAAQRAKFAAVALPEDAGK